MRDRAVSGLAYWLLVISIDQFDLNNISPLCRPLHISGTAHMPKSLCAAKPYPTQMKVNVMGDET